MAENSTPFERFLKTNGIPYLPPRRAEGDDSDFCFSVLTSILRAADQGVENIEKFLFTQAVKNCSSLGEAAAFLWKFYRSLTSLQPQHYEFSLVLQLIDGQLGAEELCFYLKCKKLFIKTHFGDSPDLDVFNLEKLIISTQDWVPVLSQAFAGTYSPTASVQRLSQRLVDTDYTDTIPASVLLECCMAEFQEVQQRKKAPRTPPRKGHKPKCESLDQLFYRNPERLFEAVSQAKPLTKKSAPSDFSLMNFGKHPFREPKPKASESMRPSTTLFYDEELAQASVDDRTEVRVRAVPFNGFQATSEPENKAEVSMLREEVGKLRAEQGQSQAAVEELMTFCQRVSSQHDQLLTQNGKLKRLLSLVTDRLIRLDPKLIKDIDFTEVINDPCRDFSPMSSSIDPQVLPDCSPALSLPNLPFSSNAGRDIKKRTATPSIPETA